MSQKYDAQEKAMTTFTNVLIIVFLFQLTPILDIITRIRFNKETQHLEGRTDT